MREQSQQRSARACEGRLQIRSYDGKDGVKRWITEVIADRFEFIRT